MVIDQPADQCVPKPHTAIEQVVRDVIRLQPVDRATFNVDIDLTIIVIIIMCRSVVTVKLFCTFLMLSGLTCVRYVGYMLFIPLLSTVPICSNKFHRHTHFFYTLFYFVKMSF